MRDLTSFWNQSESRVTVAHPNFSHASLPILYGRTCVHSVRVLAKRTPASSLFFIFLFSYSSGQRPFCCVRSSRSCCFLLLFRRRPLLPFLFLDHHFHANYQDVIHHFWPDEWKGLLLPLSGSQLGVPSSRFHLFYVSIHFFPLHTFFGRRWELSLSLSLTHTMRV